MTCNFLAVNLKHQVFVKKLLFATKDDYLYTTYLGIDFMSMLAIEKFWVALVICSVLFNCLQNLCFLKFLMSNVDFDARMHT
jgi:hypothetical protein